jgi:hypothetical protein
MQHMYTVEDQVAALRTAAFHLSADGILAFDVFFPKFALLNQIGKEDLEMEWPVRSHPGRIIRRYYRLDSIDKVNQTFSITFIFRTYEAGVLVSEETAPLRMSYYSYPQLKALFLLANLKIVEQYGSFAKTPLDNSAEEMIFILQKSE